ncbi:MAG: 4Fe-4S binding protein [Desulfosalsimonadaceae bacterium]
MPVGFPKTRSGVELRILRALFTPSEARLAVFLTHRCVPAETVFARAGQNDARGISLEHCRRLLERMAARGSIFRKVSNGKACYGLVPFVIGMFEFQVNHLTRSFYEDTARYFREAYGLEYLSAPRAQMRVVPVEQSLHNDLHIATYDEIRQIIEQADGRIGVAECICRKGKDLEGDPCRMTDRRELCLGFREYFDFYRQQGWFRPVTKEEAFSIVRQSESEGLVLQATNEQYPQAVCACCCCCCGILNTLKAIPNPADFAASNYHVRVDAEKCTGCGLCVGRCPMGAVSVAEKTAVVDYRRCIGCGVCVAGCPAGALYLEKNSRSRVPPETTEDYYEALEREKSRLAKTGTVLRIVRRMGWKDLRGLLPKRDRTG